jgi:hypothetical protein
MATAHASKIVHGPIHLLHLLLVLLELLLILLIALVIGRCLKLGLNQLLLFNYLLLAFWDPMRVRLNTSRRLKVS